MKLYVYGEHTTRAGRVFEDEMTDDELRERHGHDVDLWGEGSAAELAQFAIEEIARAEKSGSLYRLRCATNAQKIVCDRATP